MHYVFIHYSIFFLFYRNIIPTLTKMIYHLIPNVELIIYITFMYQRVALLFLSWLFLTFCAIAAEDQLPAKQLDWSFDGFTGTFDRQSIQRGFKVYKEVCSACHSLKRIAFRNLKEVGFSPEEVKSLAAGYQIADGPDDQGEMFMRPGKESDRFPLVFANDNAARAANGGALPPDMSLIVKARHDGANYIYSLLTGYQNAPEGVEMLPTQHYNPYFPGGKIAMPAPLLKEGQVEYADGTVATVEQMSKDVVNFLQWAAEPEMEERKRMGIGVMTFLAIFSFFFFFAYKNIWRRVK